MSHQSVAKVRHIDALGFHYTAKLSTPLVAHPPFATAEEIVSGEYEIVRYDGTNSRRAARDVESFAIM